MSAVEGGWLLIEKAVYGGDFLAHLPGPASKPAKAIFISAYAAR